MKKFLTLSVLALVSVAASAQVGIVGGFTSSQTRFDGKEFDTKAVSLYHVGVAYRGDLGGGFVLQPALTYQMKGATLKENIEAGSVELASKTLETKTGFVELSLGIQWGLDLLAFRPYVFAEPFVGYAVTGNENLKGSLAGWTAGDNTEINEFVQNAKNKLEYGFGVGIGVDITEHLQISGQWFMNLGNLYDDGKLDGDAVKSTFVSSYKDISNYNGFKVSLAIFF